MQKITITQITRNMRTSARTNKAYESVSLKSQEYGDRFINGFGRADNKSWKVGDVVEVEVKEVEKDGKTFLNFDMPERAKSLGFTQEDRDRLLRIEILLQKMQKDTKAEDYYPSNDMPDSPF